ncbi:hypothetical protein Patl1_25580 [Pistacia atlantica]|uniref:Uncharacterized protein n=1 Tax=Pistacia atlantica TaxID=434234 RepID=A0ACC1B006_9ROSI|nr:hypothetical protein Patl1_25580 [Pistacia atlantica]
MDRVLQYIPELEIEIEKLTLRKKKLHSKTENEQNPCQNPQLELEAPTVSVHEVVKGEVIVQITLILKDHDTNFSKLLENLEEEGRSIMSASTLQVCKERVCYNMHIQMNGSSLADDYVAVLREKIVSLLS